MAHDVWGTVPQWLSAAAAFVGVGIAWRASLAWRRTLTAKRGDDLLTAVFDLAATVGSTTSMLGRRVNQRTYGAQVDRLYASFSQLERTFTIASRSHPQLEAQQIIALRTALDGAVESTTPMHDHLGAPQDAAHEAAIGRFRNLQVETEAVRAHIRQIIS